MALVTVITGDCPGCGAEKSFGIIDVHRTEVSRGCGSCRYLDSVGLPAIKKKVIYLDQFFFSHTFRGKEPRFMEAAAKIKRMAALQLLVAPYSSVHEDETHQWKDRYDDLFDFIKASSRGHEFEPAYEVERIQVINGFNAWLKGKLPGYEPSRDEAVPAEADHWDSYFRIEVGGYTGEVDLIRQLKGQAVEGLVDLFPGWRESRLTFEENLRAEHDAACKMYLDFYIQFAARIASGDFMAFVNSPIASMVVQGMMHCLPDTTPMDERLRKCATFLKSEHFAQLPYQWVSAHIYATLKKMVKDGAYTNREKALERLAGFYEDVKHIATYAPYCDAIVIDQPMAALVSKPTIALEETFGVRVFSLNNWGDLLAWLDGLETNMDPFHKWGLEQAYPRHKF